MLDVAKQRVAFNVCLWHENTWQIRESSLFFFLPHLEFLRQYLCLKQKQDVAMGLNADGCTGNNLMNVRQRFRLYLVFLSYEWIS